MSKIKLIRFFLYISGCSKIQNSRLISSGNQGLLYRWIPVHAVTVWRLRKLCATSTETNEQQDFQNKWWHFVLKLEDFCPSCHLWRCRLCWRVLKRHANSVACSVGLSFNRERINTFLHCISFTPPSCLWFLKLAFLPSLILNYFV